MELPGGHPLKDAHAKLDAAVREASNQQCTVLVTFSDDTVTVGTKAYPIQRGGGTPRIHVGSKKINVDALRALLTEKTHDTLL